MSKNYPLISGSRRQPNAKIVLAVKNTESPALFAALEPLAKSLYRLAGFVAKTKLYEYVQTTGS